MITTFGVISAFVLISLYSFAWYRLIVNREKHYPFLVSILLAFGSLMLTGLISVIWSPRFALSAHVLTFMIFLFNLTDKQLRTNFCLELKVYFFPLFAWLILAVNALILSGISITPPESLPDGAFVFKNWHKPIEMQIISGNLPMDNALPYYTAEFLVRQIDIKAVHPIMPGQEIILRTYGLPFLYLAGRALFTLEQDVVSIPSFEYVGISWPDVRPLYNIDLYSFYNGLMFVFLAFIAFVIVVVFQAVYPSRRTFLLPLFISTFPFLLLQTYFTWAKNLVIALAMLVFYGERKSNKRIRILALICGFLIHPMILIFTLAYIVYYLLAHRKVPWDITITYILCHGFWTLYGLSTGLRNDLIQQSLNLAQSLPNQVMARVVSLVNYFNIDFLRGFPFNSSQIVSGVIASPASYLVILTIGLSVLQKSRLDLNFETIQWLRFSLISLLITTLIYSSPTPVAMFGGQILICILICILYDRVRKGILYTIPLLVNISLILLYIRHLNPTDFALN